MLSPVKRGNSRDAILDAADSIVLEDGAAHLTLDAAAERAGISKGGLLYNFPTKEALLQAMVARFIERHCERRAESLETLPRTAGRELKACLHTAMGPSECSGAKSLGVAMIAAGANDPKLLEPVREFHRRRLGWLEAAARDGLPFERVAVASLAVDGLCLLEMLQLSPFSAEQRRRILNDLLQLIDETEESAAAGAQKFEVQRG